MKQSYPILPVLASLMGMVPPLSGQQASFKVDVDAVQILATVRDEQGRIVDDLTREDFILEEEGRLQTIEYFSRQDDLPLVLGLLVDTSLSQRQILEEERQASYQFFDHVLRPEQDLAFVMSFDVEVELQEDLTASRENLQKALGSLRTPEGPFPAGVGTVLFDSVFLSADEILRHEGGRKAMIVISDGMDFGSMVSLDRAIEMAQRFDAIIYTIRYHDAGWKPGSRRLRSGGRMGRGPGRSRGGGPQPPLRQQLPDGKETLGRLARETGGSMFEVTKKQSLQQIFRTIEEELRHQYVIGFSPIRKNSGNTYRKIRLRTTGNSGFTVSCRDGYFLGSRQEEQE